MSRIPTPSQNIRGIMETIGDQYIVFILLTSVIGAVIIATILAKKG